MRREPGGRLAWAFAFLRKTKDVTSEWPLRQASCRAANQGSHQNDRAPQLAAPADQIIKPASDARAPS
jgi:hypothetical protein